MSSTRLDDREYDLIEMFAGISMVAKCGRRLGLHCAAVDIDFDKVTSRPGAMDLTTPSGFLQLA